MKQLLFLPQPMPHSGYSKDATSSKANSHSEEFTLDIVQWLFLSVEPPAWQTFHAVCISNTLQPLDLCEQGELAFAKAHEIQTLPFCLPQKQILCL